MKTCLYRPITLNIIAYQIFPQLYDIQPSLDSYVEQAHFNGTLLIDNLTDNVKTTYQYVSMIDFTSYAGKHIRISNSNQLGNVFVGEWNIEGTPLPEIEMPDSIKEHMVLWYDIARQGATNESMAANPILRDFSGNNHNGECIGFDWTSDSGIKEDGAIVSDGVDDWVYVPNLPRLTSENGFTVIAQRQRLGDSSIYAAFASKATDATETDGAFILERFDSNGDVNNVRVRSFGAVTNITEAADDIIWCTSHKYQGIDLTVGDDKDSTELALFKFSCNPTEQYCGKYAMYKFLLFDKDLSDKEIAWVMSYLMDVDFTSSFLEIHTEPATVTYEEQNYDYTTDFLYWYITDYGLNAEYDCRTEYIDVLPSWTLDQNWLSITGWSTALGQIVNIHTNIEQNNEGQRTCTITINMYSTVFNSIDVDKPPIQALADDAKIIVQITQEGDPTPTFKTAAEAVAGDAVLYDQTNDHLVIVSSNDVAKCATGYTPVGVVVVPGNHDVYGDGSCGIMSLKYMSCKNKEGSSIFVTNMYWGDYDGIDPSILPYRSVVSIGNNSEGTTISADSYGYLPSLQVSDYPCLHDTDVYYQVSDHQSPSPYLTDGTRNPGYYSGITPSSSNSLADFDGKSNTNKIITARGIKDYTSWSPIAYNKSHYPAASCCDMFYTDGTQQGDWYLPACGELGYLVPVFDHINEFITSILNTYGASIGDTLYRSNYWSSSRSYSNYARRIDMLDGEIPYGGPQETDGSYVRAFLKVNNSMLQPKPTYNFIDLGLPSGNLWCDRNLGASSPEDAGLYFQWGDTQGYTAEQVGNEEGKKYFGLADYKWAIENPGGADGYAYTKYFTGDDKTTLDPEDDAAYIMLGNEYRMPTLDDLIELCQNTDLYLVTTDGEEIKGNIAESSIYVLWFKYENDSSDIKGIKFYKKNDRETYLFVPASGFAGGGSVYSVGSIGNLWTSSLNPSSDTSAGNLNFKSDNGYIFYTVRHNGLSIRAIKPGEQTITNAVLTENNEALLLEDSNPIMLES